MHTAPPTLPGIPWANSSPVRLCCWANTAARASDAPASAVTRPAASSDTPDMSRVFTTSRSSPSSGNSRFVPLPMTSGAAPQARASSISSTIWLPSLGNAMRRAGPPMRNDAYLARGTSCSYVMSGR